jgi:hypothetical protein
LLTGKLRGGAPEDRITKSLDIAFDPDAECSRWEQFLSEIFEKNTELINFIQRSVGYSLTGATDEQCFWLLYGRGANGKSVFLSVLLHVLGPYAYNAPFSTFERHVQASASNDLAALDELHDFACRFGSAQDGSMIYVLVGEVMAGIVYNAVAKGWPTPLSTEQTKALGELHAKLGMLNSQLKAASSPGAFYMQFQSPQNTQQLTRYVLQYGVDEMSGGRALGIQFLESTYNDLQAEQTALSGNVRQTWEEIERFDYTKIGWD